MSKSSAALAAHVGGCLDGLLGENGQIVDANDEVTVQVAAEQLIDIATRLRDDDDLHRP